MSPRERCSRCGKKRIFHEDEMKGARKGRILCMACTLDQNYYEFLAEILDGKHKELMQQLYQDLLDDR